MGASRSGWLLCLLIGCSSSGGGGGFASDAGAGTGGMGSGSASGGTSGTQAGGQTAACARYVSCVGATSASELGSVIDTYGPSGSCWSGGAELSQTCDQACQSALVQKNELFPEKPTCGECQSNADCKDPEKPHCPESTHRCSVSADPQLALCLNVLGGCGNLDEGFVCAEKSCGSEFAACFGTTGKCGTLMTCMATCGSCGNEGCIQNCVAGGIAQDCMDECLSPETGPLYECMQSSFCAC